MALVAYIALAHVLRIVLDVLVFSALDGLGAAAESSQPAP